MPSLRDIRRRIRTVKNTAQITRAMEMVAATRMRRAQTMALASRPYSEKLRDVLQDLASRIAIDERIPLLTPREVRRLAVLLMTSDRGLCGALNSNVLLHTLKLIEERGLPAQIVAVGRKGREWAVRHGLPLLAEFTHLGDRPAHEEIAPVGVVLADAYLHEQVDQVWVVYPQFVNTLIQKPMAHQLIPVQPGGEGRRFHVDYIYEPDPAAVLTQLLPRYIEVEIYQALLETVASEHSARMVAMRNATENANGLVEDLTLQYNKTRQEVITKELLEIAGGANSLGR
ncbi:MAG: ATP synthase F1 subunit gamma [Chloroflexi bacterium]|nr:ATP synthase F1 subunit gamma [Chloroflexota bacterium]